MLLALAAARASLQQQSLLRICTCCCCCYCCRKEVTFLLDAKLKDSEMPVMVHPMHNFESLEVAARDIISFLVSRGVAIEFIDCKGRLLQLQLLLLRLLPLLFWILLLLLPGCCRCCCGRRFGWHARFSGCCSSSRPVELLLLQRRICCSRYLPLLLLCWRESRGRGEDRMPALTPLVRLLVQTVF